MQSYLPDVDLILAEGFKRQPLPKIEIFRTDGPHGHPLFLDHPDLIALVTDAPFTPSVPVLDWMISNRWPCSFRTDSEPPMNAFCIPRACPAHMLYMPACSASWS